MDEGRTPAAAVARCIRAGTAPRAAHARTLSQRRWPAGAQEPKLYVVAVLLAAAALGGSVALQLARKAAAAATAAGLPLDVGGQAKDMRESFEAALAALALAVIFNYLSSRRSSRASRSRSRSWRRSRSG